VVLDAVEAARAAGVRTIGAISQPAGDSTATGGRDP
jgi:hypothetical protein